MVRAIAAGIDGETVNHKVATTADRFMRCERVHKITPFKVFGWWGLRPVPHLCKRALCWGDTLCYVVTNLSIRPTVRQSLSPQNHPANGQR